MHATWDTAFVRTAHPTAGQALAFAVTWPVDWGQWPAAWSVSWPVALIGLGLIICARIMRTSAGMRADLEGTV